ncbi:MAG TPA: integrase [Ruminococcus sp.]|nr:integrase [Ruminococcus sp.]
MKKITDKIIKKFKEYLIDEEKSKATIEKYIRDLTVFVCWLGGAELSKTKVLGYKEYIISKYAPASVNSILSSLNSFFDFIGEYGLKVKNLKIQKQIFAKNEKELTKAEYDRLLAAAKAEGNQKLNLLMQTICATGIRVSELKYITVEVLKDGRADVNMKGKLRVIIIPKELCRMLKKYAAEQKISSGSIFVTKTGRPLDRTNIWKLMKSLCESANVDKGKVFPHNLRHLFARTFYSIENDIVRLADILGHSSVNTTRIYTMDTWEICRRQVQRLGLLRC